MPNPLDALQSNLGLTRLGLAHLTGISKQALIRTAKGATARPFRIAQRMEHLGLLPADQFLAEYAVWRQRHRAKMRSRLIRRVARA